jgi:hypothetical protein
MAVVAKTMDILREHFQLRHWKGVRERTEEVLDNRSRLED